MFLFRTRPRSDTSYLSLRLGIVFQFSVAKANLSIRLRLSTRAEDVVVELRPGLFKELIHPSIVVVIPSLPVRRVRNEIQVLKTGVSHITIQVDNVVPPPGLSVERTPDNNPTANHGLLT